MWCSKFLPVLVMVKQQINKAHASINPVNHTHVQNTLTNREKEKTNMNTYSLQLVLRIIE